MPRLKEVEINGVKYPSIAAAAKALGVKENALRYRLSAGIADGDPQASRKGNGRRVEIEVDGKTYPSLGAACAAYGTSIRTYNARIKRGWEQQTAITSSLRYIQRDKHLEEQAGERQCTCCKETKPLAAFGAKRKNTWVSRCLDCRSLYAVRRYGLTEAQFRELLEKQKGCCAICGTDTPGGQGRFHVDHCHKSGHVRGLLCSNCNTGLGQFKDSPGLMLRGADYLEKGSVA